MFSKSRLFSTLMTAMGKSGIHVKAPETPGSTKRTLTVSLPPPSGGQALLSRKETPGLDCGLPLGRPCCELSPSNSDPWLSPVTAGALDEAHWPTEYPTCGGRRQSPIDLQRRKVQYNPSLKALNLTGYEVQAGEFPMINNGHTGKGQVAGRCPQAPSSGGRCQGPERHTGDTERRLGAAGHRRVVASTPSCTGGPLSLASILGWLLPSAY